MNIGPDKIQHFVAGLIITVAVGMWQRPYQGFTLAVVIGGAKEVYDIRGPGTADWLDFFVTVLGAIAGYIVVRVLKTAFHILKPAKKLLDT